MIPKFSCPTIPYLSIGGLAVLVIAMCAVCGSAQQTEQEVAVIANPANPADSITSAELRKIYSGDKVSWGGGLAIIVYTRAPPAHERDILLSVVMKMTDAEYKDFWVKKIYSDGAGHEPTALLSNGMQLEGVRSQKGSIALINTQER